MKDYSQKRKKKWIKKIISCFGVTVVFILKANGAVGLCFSFSCFQSTLRLPLPLPVDKLSDVQLPMLPIACKRRHPADLRAEAVGLPKPPLLE